MYGTVWKSCQITGNLNTCTGMFKINKRQTSLALVLMPLKINSLPTSSTNYPNYSLTHVHVFPYTASSIIHN